MREKTTGEEFYSFFHTIGVLILFGLGIYRLGIGDWLGFVICMGACYILINHIKE